MQSAECGRKNRAATVVGVLVLAMGAALGQPGIGGDVQTGLHLRTGALDSAAASWFETRAKLDFAPELGERVAAKLGLEFRLDGFPSLSSVTQLGDAARFEPVTVLLGETYLRVYDALPGLTLTAGRQLVHWGTADAINPTDNFVTPDYSDPLVWDARRPVWMLHADYSPASQFGLEVAAKPVFEPALAVPGRWYSTEYLPSEAMLRAGLVQQLLARGLDSATAQTVASLYTINIGEEFELPGNSLEAMTWGGRARTHFSVFDFSASLLRGYDFLPTAVPVTVTDTLALVMDFTLRERYARRTVVGADAAASVAGIGLWAEAGYSLYDDSLIDDDFSVIGGLDYTLAGFYLNAQYLHGQFPLALAQTTAEPVRDFVLGAVERKLLGDRVLLRLGGAVDAKHGSLAGLPLLRWLPADGVQIDIGGLFFGGKAGSAFAALDASDEVFLGARYQF
jgi:hypothetical protein